MDDYQQMFERELLDPPHEVPGKFLTHFQGDAGRFVTELAQAARVWEQYAAIAKKYEQSQPQLFFSAAYFLDAINSALVSTRLLLTGHIVPSGNMARHTVESLAFAVLLAFPKTGAYRDFKDGRAVEYMSVGRLARKRNAACCGVDETSVEKLKAQAKNYDRYSHTSGDALKAIWIPACTEFPQGTWNIGAVFVPSDLETQYRPEMANRIHLAELLANAIAGAHAKLIDQGSIEAPK